MEPALTCQEIAGQFADRTGQYPESMRLRLQRALSWLERAGREDADPDAQFVFLWVAFNAAYASEFSSLDDGGCERGRFSRFLGKLVALDDGKSLARLVFEQFSGPVRMLLDNHFVFEPFWRAVREHDPSERWKAAFTGSKKLALASIVAGDAATTLAIVLDRLYVLRNQLIHGAATWGGEINRGQVNDGVRIMRSMVPAILSIMINHPEAEFGDVAYPEIGRTSARPVMCASTCKPSAAVGSDGATRGGATRRGMASR